MQKATAQNWNSQYDWISLSNSQINPSKRYLHEELVVKTFQGFNHFNIQIFLKILFFFCYSLKLWISCLWTSTMTFKYHQHHISISSHYNVCNVYKPLQWSDYSFICYLEKFTTFHVNNLQTFNHHLLISRSVKAPFCFIKDYYS